MVFQCFSIITVVVGRVLFRTTVTWTGSLSPRNSWPSIEVWQQICFAVAGWLLLIDRHLWFAEVAFCFFLNGLWCVCVAETTYFVHIFHVNVVPFVIIIHGSGVLQYRGGSASLMKNSSNLDNLMGISSFCSQCFSGITCPKIHDWESHGCYYMVVRRVKFHGDWGLRTISMMQAPRSVPWFSPMKLMIISAKFSWHKMFEIKMQFVTCPGEETTCVFNAKIE